MATVERLAQDRLLTFDGQRVRLTGRGRLLSNEVFQEFLETGIGDEGPGISSVASQLQGA